MEIIKLFPFLSVKAILLFILGISRSVVSDSAIPWTIAHQAPLSMEFHRRENWSGLPFSSSGDLPDPGIEPGSPTLQVESLPLSHQGS